MSLTHIYAVLYTFYLLAEVKSHSPVSLRIKAMHTFNDASGTEVTVALAPHTTSSFLLTVECVCFYHAAAALQSISHIGLRSRFKMPSIFLFSRRKIAFPDICAPKYHYNYFTHYRFSITGYSRLMKK